MFPTKSDRSELSLVPLPTDVLDLLSSGQARPRLVAHLTLVHDAGVRIAQQLARAWPALPVDRKVMTFGMAIHDIGKVLHPEELSAPGRRHEADGEAWLIERGVPAEHARFARTHGAWEAVAELGLEDLVVILADTCWKGQRARTVEDAVVARIASVTGAPVWQVFMKLDEIVAQVASDADARLAWQGRFPIDS